MSEQMAAAFQRWLHSPNRADDRENAFEAGWHARDETIEQLQRWVRRLEEKIATERQNTAEERARVKRAHQEKDDLREILDEHRKALRACKEERGRLTAERSELRRERDRERARAEAAEGRVRVFTKFAEEVLHETSHPNFVGSMGNVDYLRTLAEAALTDPAVSEAMRESERADGGGEETTGEDRPALRFAPGTRLLWYPRSRSRPHYDERVPAIVVRDDGDGPWLMIRVRTKAGREIERWVERGELSLEPTGEASGAGEPAGK